VEVKVKRKNEGGETVEKERKEKEKPVTETI